jgi:ferredoxin
MIVMFSARLLSTILMLGRTGVAAEALHCERFTLGAAGDSDEGWTLAYEGERFPFGGRPSLLDAIEARCLAIDSDCRTGTCGRCMLAVEEGEAQHRITPEYAVPPRHVLACCAVPKSDVRLRAVGAAQ